MHLNPTEMNKTFLSDIIQFLKFKGLFKIIKITNILNYFRQIPFLLTDKPYS